MLELWPNQIVSLCTCYWGFQDSLRSKFGLDLDPMELALSTSMSNEVQFGHISYDLRVLWQFFSMKRGTNILGIRSKWGRARSDTNNASSIATCLVEGIRHKWSCRSCSCICWHHTRAHRSCLLLELSCYLLFTKLSPFLSLISATNNVSSFFLFLLCQRETKTRTTQHPERFFSVSVRSSSQFSILKSSQNPNWNWTRILSTYRKERSLILWYDLI
jgi:hypothetical protein